ncbi:MAG: hypothetical protein J5999_11010 [Oscillospiraceae bacterium]|nr:hypothetical protein [Oscillospiraceae bacterium]
MEDKLEKMLKTALSADFLPEKSINDEILERAKEKSIMSKTGNKKVKIAIIACAAAAVCTLTAAAAYRLLSPSEAAERVDNPALSQAFEGENAVLTGETRTDGEYSVTFLGAVSGKNSNISDNLYFLNGELLDERTYAVVAISRTDGKPMEDAPLFVSPYIKGLDPLKYNIATMKGGYRGFAENGVVYRIISCDNIEMFADRGLYIGVSDADGVFFNRDAYNYNAETGEITENPDFDGVNLLFDLPIDVSKADPDAAAEYINKMEIFFGGGTDSEEPSEGEGVPEPEVTAEAVSEFHEWEQVEESAVYVKAE